MLHYNCQKFILLESLRVFSFICILTQIIYLTIVCVVHLFKKLRGARDPVAKQGAIRDTPSHAPVDPGPLWGRWTPESLLS